MTGWLGPEVPGTRARTTWACPVGHEWQTTYASVRSGTGCPHCVGNRRKTPEDSLAPAALPGAAPPPAPLRLRGERWPLEDRPLYLTYAAYQAHERSDGWADFLAGRAGQTWWREVFMLMAGHLLSSPQQARRFLLDELGKLPGEGDAPAYGLAWAGRALLEIPPQRVGWYANACDELARRLLVVLWQNPPKTSVAVRIEAGEVQGRPGDPRFQGELCLPEFISIPGGVFWMGTDEAEVERLARETGGNWPKREVPRHQVELSDYALARYPATNAMYACFMDDGGYTDRRWWAEGKSAFGGPMAR